MLCAIVYSLLQIVDVITWLHLLCGFGATDVKFVQMESQVEWNDSVRVAHRQFGLAKNILGLCFLRVKADPGIVGFRRNCIRFSVEKAITVVKD